jgi:hypothetical protein
MMHADNETPYTINVINNSDDDGVSAKFSTRNTHDKHSMIEALISLKTGSNQNVSLKRDLREITVNTFNQSSDPNPLLYINVDDNSNGTQKYRRGAQVFIYGGVIPTSSDTTAYPREVIVCPSGTVQSTNYVLSPTDPALTTCYAYKNQDN